MSPTIYADIPRHFWDSSSPIHDDARAAYGSLVGAAVKLGCRFSAASYVAAINDGLSAGEDDSVHYAYHASRPGENTWCFKPSPINGLWYMDPDGYSGWSSIANSPSKQRESMSFDLARATSIVVSIRDNFTSTNQSRYPQPLAGVQEELRGRPFLFYPMQIGADKVMQFARFSQTDILRQLAAYAASYGYTVAVKRHPLCKSDLITETLKELAGTQFIVVEGSIHSILAECVAVVVCNSSVGLEALVHGKPVFSLALSEYSHLTTEVHQLTELEELFQTVPAPQSTDTIRGLGYLLDEFFVQAHDVHAVAKRMAGHLEGISTRGFPGRVHVPTNVAPNATLLHALERRTDDAVDFLLASYPQMNKEIKGRIATLLARAARFDSRRERILGTADLLVQRRYLGLLISDSDLAQADTLAQKLADRPGQSEDLLALAKVRYRQNRPTEGLKLALRAVKVTPPTAEALVFLGRKLFEKTTPALQEVRRLASSALEVDPRYADAFWLRSRAAYFLGQLDNAEDDITHALHLAPQDARYARLKELIVEAKMKTSNYAS